MDNITRTAVLSDCGQYRYQLHRTWDKSFPKCMFMMLNPSTADATTDDNTIRRCIGFAKAWGYGGLMVGNLFSFRSTRPELLLQQPDPIGPENLDNISKMVNLCEIVVLAWGNAEIVNRILKLYPNYEPLQNIQVENIHYFKLTSGGGGHPVHPLYLKASTPLFGNPFNPIERPVISEDKLELF